MTTLPADRHHVHAAAHDHGAGHHEIGFIRKYIFSMDHKVIGIQFMFMSLTFLIVGGLLALAVRWQIAWPFDLSQPVPGISIAYFSAVTQSATMTGDFYNMLFTMHATFMIFFVIIPMLVGAFGNLLIPLMIGTKDMAFPLLNMLSFWVALTGGIIVSAAFFIESNDRILTLTATAQAGWTSYPPMAGPEISPLHGQSLWLLGLIFVGSSSLMGAINYLTTILNLRAPGMTLFRMPLSIWSLFITSILALMATPVLAGALLMLLFDREFGTRFFVVTNEVRAGAAAGAVDSGQPLLFQHLFWFYSHPAVYIMILPAMGITSDVIATFSRKPIFGYKPMVFAIAGIAFLGFIVWGHHMFASGMNPVLGTTFTISTMMIALPSAIKVFNWLGTLWRGQIHYTPAMLFAIGFVSMFVIGGLTGIFMACTPVDLYFHDTYFIVGHIHYVLFSGSLFGIFAGIYYWFPKVFGRNLNQRLGVLHFWLTFIGFNLTFFLMHVIGIGAHPRRYASILAYPTLEYLQPLNIVMTIGALMLGMAQIPFVVNFLGSLGRYGNRAVIYPLILTALEFTPLHPLSRAWNAGGDGWFMMTGVGVLAALFIIMGLIDAIFCSILNLAWDKHLNRVLVAATWITVFPLFFLPVFAKGDFWEWIGSNSTTYRISQQTMMTTPTQPMPVAVDLSRTEPSVLLRTALSAGAVGDPLPVPVVTAVMVNAVKLRTDAVAAGIDLASTPVAAHLASPDRFGIVGIPTDVIAGLDEKVKPLVESSRLMVSAIRAEVERQNLTPNHQVSRTWQSALTSNTSMVVWTDVNTGWMVTFLTGILGLAYLVFTRGRGLDLGEPVGSNPWRANSLEWYATSPPWHENFPTTPHVYRGPYEFSSPASKRDYLPQWEKLPDGVKEPADH